MLAGLASNSASHGGPFNEERLDDSIRGNILERLIKQRTLAYFGYYLTWPDRADAKYWHVSIFLIKKVFS